MRSSFAIGLGMLVTVLALEVFLQFMPVVSGLRMERSTGQVLFGRYLPRQAYVYSYGWALANARRGSTNLQGFSNSADFKDDAAVLVIGDSFIESLMLDYAETLQGRLDHALGGSVFAASISGNGLADTLEVLGHFGPRLHPRTVVLFVEPSDMREIVAPAQRGHTMFEVRHGKVALRHNPYVESKAKQLVGHSALVRYLYYNLKFPDWAISKLRRGGTAVEASVHGTTPDAARFAALEYYMTQLRTLGGVANTRFIFVVDGDRQMLYTPGKSEPTWKAGDRALFMASAARHGYQVVDMQPVFARHWALRRERMDFLPMDGHWNKVAHGLAAQQILTLLATTSPLQAERQAAGK